MHQVRACGLYGRSPVASLESDTFGTGEWYYDEQQQQLYIWSNDSSSSPPAPGDVVAAAHITIINATGAP